MKMLNDFAIFILTHGRPNNVHTYKTLLKCGYTGCVYFIVDDLDLTLKDYINNFGKQVITFSKTEIAKTFDEADNFQKRNTIVYARNASFQIAKNLGLTYFMQLDDDYTTFAFKFTDKQKYKETKILNLNKALNYLLDFYKSIPTIKTLAIAQNGDFIGGGSGSFAQDPTLKRKAMNTFICSTERPFNFIGRVNEDVNTYCYLGQKGQLFLTMPLLAINQKQTQKNKGGMTDSYLDGGTYVKSFYTVMYCPSSVKVALMGSTNMRLHHRVNWNNTVPVILNEKYKK